MLTVQVKQEYLEKNKDRFVEHEKYGFWDEQFEQQKDMQEMNTITKQNEIEQSRIFVKEMLDTSCYDEGDEQEKKGMWS